MTGRARLLLAAIAVALVAAMGSLGWVLWQQSGAAAVASAPTRVQLGRGALDLALAHQRLLAEAETARQAGAGVTDTFRDRFDRFTNDIRVLRGEPFRSALSEHRAYYELLDRAEPALARLQRALAPAPAGSVEAGPGIPGRSAVDVASEVLPPLRLAIESLLSATTDLMVAQGEERRAAVERLSRLAGISFFTAILLLGLFAGLAATFVLRAQRAARERERLAEALADQTAAAEAEARAKGELLATVSHELRTPLQGLMGMIDLLGESASLEESERDQVRTIRQCAGDLMVLANDLVDLAQLRAGRLKLKPAAANVEELVGQVAALLQTRAGERRNRLLVEVSPTMPLWWTIDPARLRQILFNLVGNALKFTEGGTVWVAVTHQPDGPGQGVLRLTVADTGAGIASDGLTTLFRRFDPSARTPREGGGAGLGLAITHELVELMGGRIEVDSALGRGTTVEVSLLLPLAEAPEPQPLAAPGTAAASAETGGGPLRILAVDDVAVNRRLLKVILGRAGHQCDEAASGEAAVEAVRNTAYDVVLMDVLMPGLDGPEATRRIRALPGAAGLVPVIAVTANVLAEQRNAYLAAGMDDFVTKPVQAQELMAALARARAGVRVVERRQAAQAARAAQAHARAPAPSARPLDALALLDGRTLERLRGALPPAEVGRLLRALDIDAGRLAGELLESVKKTDAAALRRVAHALRGAYAILGTPRLAAIAGTVETITDDIAALRLAPALAETLVATRAAARRDLGLEAEREREREPGAAAPAGPAGLRDRGLVAPAVQAI